MRNIKLHKNPYVLFFPFLVLYIIYVLLFPPDGAAADAPHYLSYAKSLLNFHFKEPLFETGWIPTGPGYPIILMPFVLFKLPLICITILNALFLYLSIVLIFKTLKLTVTQRIAILVSLFWAFYFFHLRYIKSIATEAFTIFLITLFTYSVLKTFSSIRVKKNNKYLIISGFTLGFIVLTKVIFGYVVLALLLGSIILRLIHKKSSELSRVLMILLISIGLTIPYLSYTYYHTGKIFYWATSGGDNLYWMSSTYEYEHGSWLNFKDLKQILTNEQNELKIFYYNDSNIAKHLRVWEDIATYNKIPQDDQFNLIQINYIQDDKLKSIAINNIKKNPIEFFKNWIGNIGRILFNYPNSYELQNSGSLVYFPVNGIICVLFLLTLIPVYKSWHKINFGIRFLLFFSFIYLGGSTFGSAEIRMFIMIIPIILVWIVYIMHNMIKINFKFNTLLPKINKDKNFLK